MELNRLSLFVIVTVVLIFAPIMFVIKWIKIVIVILIFAPVMFVIKWIEKVKNIYFRLKVFIYVVTSVQFVYIYVDNNIKK